MGNWPTRKGPWIGRGNERQMMSETDLGGFRKRYRTNADGSVTMLKTRAGWPQFTTTETQPNTPIKPSVDVIFQAYPWAEIAWPSTPFLLDWSGEHTTSKRPELVLETTTQKLKGNTTWLGSPKVVSWFGLSPFGPNDSAVFEVNGGPTTRHNRIGMNAARETFSPETVWIDGQPAFNVNSPYRVLCAALSGGKLRLVMYNRTMITTTTTHSASSSGAFVGYKFTSPLHLLEIDDEGAGSVVYSGSINVIPVASFYPYTLVQNFRFNAAGTHFVGIVGYYTGTRPMVTRVVEYEFSSGTKTVDLRYGDEVERFNYMPSYPEDPYYASFVVNTGLPVLNSSYIKFNFQTSGNGSDEITPLAVGYENGETLRILCKRKQSGSAYNDLFKVRDKEAGLGSLPTNTDTDCTYIKFDVADIADENFAALNAARASIGLGPAPATTANYGPINPMVFTGVPDNNERESGARLDGVKPVFLWACSERRKYAVQDDRFYVIERFELHDSTGEKVSGGYDRAVQVTTQQSRNLRNSTGTESWVATVGFPTSTETRTVTNGGLSANYEVTVVGFEHVKSFLPDADVPSIVVEEDAGIDDVVAADLRHGLFVREQAGVRSISVGLPSRPHPWTVPFVKNLDDIEKSLTFENLVKPIFGISAFTTHGSGGHAVFAQTDPWSGGNQLTYWGSGSAVFSGPFEAPIFFRK